MITHPGQLLSNGYPFTGQSHRRNSDGQLVPTGQFYRNGYLVKADGTTDEPILLPFDSSRLCCYTPRYYYPGGKPKTSAKQKVFNFIACLVVLIVFALIMAVWFALV